MTVTNINHIYPTIPITSGTLALAGAVKSQNLMTVTNINHINLITPITSGTLSLAGG